MARTTPTEPSTEVAVAVEPVVEPVVEEIAITASDFVRDASHAVAVNGLLASDEKLRTAELPEAKWEALLEKYMTSPRPAPQD